MIKKILKRIYRAVMNYKTDSSYMALDIRRSEARRLRKEKGSKKTSLYGKDIEITNFFWYRHGLNEIFLEQSYQFNSNKVNPIILDCGANTGLSVIFFKRLYPQAKITAFEADAEIANILQSNLHNFGYDDVTIIPKAVWTENTTLEFKSDGSVGGQIVQGGENTVKIEAIRLKEYLNTEVDFLKIDIEGVEYEVLKDCSENLVNVHNLFIEYHSFLKEEQMLDQILLMLKKAGFKYYIKEAWNNMPIPFVDNQKSHYDLQLNIFAYRL